MKERKHTTRAGKIRSTEHKQNNDAYTSTNTSELIDMHVAATAKEHSKGRKERQEFW